MQVKVKLAPIIRMLVVTTTVALIVVFTDTKLRGLLNYEILMKDSSWILADLVHIPQFLIPFLLICYITKGKPGEYGFNLKEDPPLFTHKRMLIMGISFGLPMSLRYVVQIFRNVSLDIPRPGATINILRHMTFQWIVVGVSEETMFRELIQTYVYRAQEETMYQNIYISLTRTGQEASPGRSRHSSWTPTRGRSQRSSSRRGLEETEDVFRNPWRLRRWREA